MRLSKGGSERLQMRRQWEVRGSGGCGVRYGCGVYTDDCCCRHTDMRMVHSTECLLRSALPAPLTSLDSAPLLSHPRAGCCMEEEGEEGSEEGENRV